MVGPLGTRFTGLIGHVTIGPRAPMEHKLPTQSVNPELGIKLMNSFFDNMLELTAEDLGPDRMSRSEIRQAALRRTAC